MPKRKFQATRPRRKLVSGRTVRKMKKEICKNCEYYTEWNGDIVCIHDTIKYSDCSFLVKPTNSCKKFKPKNSRKTN